MPRGEKLMGRERKGSIDVKDGRIYARITWTDETGKKRQLRRRAENRTHAHQLKRQMLAELEAHGSELVDAANMTFLQLANYYQENHITQVQYKDGRKISGLRGKRQVEQQLNTLKKHFGSQKIRSLLYGHIEKYKKTRLNTTKQPKKTDPAKPSKPLETLSIAYVNRELALLRRMFNVAIQQGWLTKNPFASGTGLISAADETKRERILTKDEESRLLELCVDRRAHLKPVIICALDTGMRYSEIAKLTWADVDFFSQLIRVQALNTKTLRSRQVPITSRLERQLKQLYGSGKQSAGKVFAIGNTIKTAFGNIRKLAGLNDLHFHDLRHTAATRMVKQGVPLQEVGRILGHTQANTTYRYVNADAETARRVGLALDAFHEEEQEKQEKELVN